MGGVGAVLDEELALARTMGASARTVVLVEGESDRQAIETLARRMGRDFEGEGVVTVAIAGATNIGTFLGILGPGGHDVALAGLCDEAEEPIFGLALEKAGLGQIITRADLETLGFFVCVRDLEEEMIRALGVEKTLALVETQGLERPWSSFVNQPAQRGRRPEDQLHRFLGTKSGRKIEFGGLLAGTVALEVVPEPLRRLLARV